jgi:hypothetical protein
MWVPPFRHPRINAYLQLPAAFRSLSRLSSALSAKASALRPSLLNLFISALLFLLPYLSPSHSVALGSDKDFFIALGSPVRFSASRQSAFSMFVFLALYSVFKVRTASLRSESDCFISHRKPKQVLVFNR